MSRGRHNAGTARLYAAASASPSARARRHLAPTPDPRDALGMLGNTAGNRSSSLGRKLWDAEDPRRIKDKRKILGRGGSSADQGLKAAAASSPPVHLSAHFSVHPSVRPPSTRPSVHPSTSTRLPSHPSVRPAVHKSNAAVHLPTTDLPVRRSVHPSSSVHLFGASVRPSEHSSIQRLPNLPSSVRPPEHSVCSSPARLSVHLSIHQFGHPSVSPSTPSVRPPTHVSIPPSIHLPVHAPTHRAHPLHPPTQEPSTTLHSGPALSNGVSVVRSSVHPSIRPPQASVHPSIRPPEHPCVHPNTLPSSVCPTTRRPSGHLSIRLPTTRPRASTPPARDA